MTGFALTSLGAPPEDHQDGKRYQLLLNNFTSLELYRVRCFKLGISISTAIASLKKTNAGFNGVTAFYATSQSVT